MNGRIYDPLLARFLSADKYVDGVYTLQGYNRYSYVKNNPLTMTDPEGEFGVVGAVVGGVIGGAIGGGVAWYNGGSGAEIAAAATGGLVTGALVGSGAGLVAAALNTGAISTGGAIVASACVGAIGSASGNVVTQVGSNMANGQSFSESVESIDGESVATSAVVGAAVGGLGGAATVLSHSVRLANAQVQATMQSNITTISTNLTAQGASSATIHQVQRQIVNGMATLGRHTANTVGAIGSAGNGGAAALTMELVVDAASVADAALNGVSSQDDQNNTAAQEPSPAPPPPPLDEELRR